MSQSVFYSVLAAILISLAIFSIKSKNVNQYEILAQFLVTVAGTIAAIILAFHSTTIQNTIQNKDNLMNVIKAGTISLDGTERNIKDYLSNKFEQNTLAKLKETYPGFVTDNLLKYDDYVSEIFKSPQIFSALSDKTQHDLFAVNQTLGDDIQYWNEGNMNKYLLKALELELMYEKSVLYMEGLYLKNEITKEELKKSSDIRYSAFIAMKMVYAKASDIELGKVKKEDAGEVLDAVKGMEKLSIDDNTFNDKKYVGMIKKVFNYE